MNKPNNPSESVKKLNPHLFGPERCVETASAMLEQMSPGKKIRQSSATPNKTELAFYEYLRSNTTKDAYIYRQGVKFHIANGVNFTPDFLVQEGGYVTAYEVKGFMRDDAAVKLKIVASLFPWIKWYLVWRADKQWNFQQVLP